MPRGGKRPGAGRAALPLSELQRPDLAERRPLRAPRPCVQIKERASERQAGDLGGGGVVEATKQDCHDSDKEG